LPGNIRQHPGNTNMKTNASELGYIRAPHH
jgi:hypothetical protein